MTLVTPVAARHVHDSVGVNVRGTWFGTAYDPWKPVLDAATSIGIRRFRDGIAVSTGVTAGQQQQARDWNEAQYRRHEESAARGIRYVVGFSSSYYKNNTLDLPLAVAAGRLRGAIVAIEGLNEYDISGDPAWVTNLRAWQKMLYQKVKATASLAGLPVVGPSFGGWYDTRDKLGDLSAYMDRGNIHPYRATKGPDPTHLAREKAESAKVSGSKLVWATEVGYQNAPNSQASIPEAAAATYLTKTVLEHFKAGIGLSFIYQLVDPSPDPPGLDGELHYGIVHPDMTFKAAAKALKHLIALLGPDGTIPMDPLDVTISDPAIRSLLMRRHDGSYLLALWRNVSVLDANRKPLEVKPIYIDVTLPAGKDVRLALPTVEPTIHPSGFSKGKLRVCLAGDPLVLTIT